jgi:hypothetical protein
MNSVVLHFASRSCGILQEGKKMGLKKISVVLLFPGFVNGCASIGPGTMARDRFDCTTAISDWWKAQMLLNVASPDPAL